MRVLFLFLCSLPVVALDNAITFLPSADQAGRPFDLFPTFAKDEICDFPQPFVGGAAKAEWQADIWSRWPASTRCPAGSVKKAWVAFRQDVTRGQTLKVDFRNNTQPCHLGTQEVCEAAALDQPGMLAAGNWDGRIQAQAFPHSDNTIVWTVSARNMLEYGNWTYRRRGPLVTQVMVEDRTTERYYDFGWRERHLARITTTMNNESTRVGVNADWSNLARPFKVHIDYEIFSVCFATADTWYIGPSGGSDPSCANLDGRAQDGTQRGVHYAEGIRSFARRVEPGLQLAAETNYGQNSITVDDASSIEAPTVLNILGELVRVCNKTENRLTVGNGNWGCTPNNAGRFYWGSNNYQLGQIRKAPVHNWSRRDVWADADRDSYKSLHPIFVVTFHKDWAGVGLEYHLANTWSDRIQDQVYDLSVSNSSGTLVSYSAVRHIAMSMWKYPDGPVVGTFTGAVADRKAWDGTPPSPGRYDYNLPYLRFTGAVPYDTSVVINAQALATQLTENSSHQGVAYAWENGTKGAIETGGSLVGSPGRSDCGPWTRDWGMPGGRPDISLHPRWYATALYAMQSNLPGAERWAEWTYGAAACGGYAPIHVWEGSTNPSLKFCSATDTPYKSCTGANAEVAAFGKPMTVDARPLATLLANQVNSGDVIRHQGQDTLNFWNVGDGASHMPQLSFIPWLLTGDWYYEQILMDSGAFTLMAANQIPGWNRTPDPYYWQMSRHGSWAFIGPYNGSRPVGWTFREIMLAGWAARSGSPEQSYFTDKVNKQLEIYEGKYNLTTGSFYRPCSGPDDMGSTPWCWGRQIQAMGTNNPEVMSFLGTHGGYEDANLSPSTHVRKDLIYSVASYWMDNYFRTSLGYSLLLGYDQAEPVANQRFFRNSINRVLHPAMNPFTLGEYRDPNVPCEPEGAPVAAGCRSRTFAYGINHQLSSYESFAAAWTATAANRNAFVNDHDKEGGYSTISRAVLALAENARDGDRTGARAWEWISTGYRFPQGFQENPQWALSPQSKHQISGISVAPGPAGTATIFFMAPDGNACRYAVDPQSSLDSADTEIPAGNRQRKLDLSGLQTGTHSVRITCGVARGEATLTVE